MKTMLRIKFFLKRNKVPLILIFLFGYYLFIQPEIDPTMIEAEKAIQQKLKKPQHHPSLFSKFKFGGKSLKSSGVVEPSSSSSNSVSSKSSSKGVGRSSITKRAKKLATDEPNSISMPPIPGTGLTTTKIPSKIWTFWHTSTLPPFLQDCLSGWIRNNPSHEITLITPQNLGEYIRSRPPHIFDIMEPSEQSAWVRLAILYEEGGIWIDLGMIITRPIRFLHDKQQELGSEGVMFFMDHFIIEPAYPFFEKFMIAAVPGATFIKMWFKEWNFIISDFNGGPDYFVHLEKTYGAATFKKLIQSCDTPSEFIQEIALLKVLRIDGSPYPPGLSAIKPSYGPLSALEIKEWNNWELVTSLFAPLGETELLVDDSIPHMIFLTPYQLKMIDWMGYFSPKVYHEMNHQSFFCLYLQNDPIDCGSKKYLSDKVCDDPSHGV